MELDTSAKQANRHLAKDRIDILAEKLKFGYTKKELIANYRKEWSVKRSYMYVLLRKAEEKIDREKILRKVYYLEEIIDRLSNRIDELEKFAGV